MTAPTWRWMRATGGPLWPDNDPPDRRLFHAYSPSGNLACEPVMGLGQGEEPNEGTDPADLCAECMTISRTSLPGAA